MCSYVSIHLIFVSLVVTRLNTSSDMLSSHFSAHFKTFLLVDFILVGVIRTTPTLLRNISNTASHLTDLGRMERLSHPCRHRGSNPETLD